MCICLYGSHKLLFNWCILPGIFHAKLLILKLLFNHMVIIKKHVNNMTAYSRLIIKNPKAYPSSFSMTKSKLFIVPV